MVSSYCMFMIEVCVWQGKWWENTVNKSKGKLYKTKSACLCLCMRLCPEAGVIRKRFSSKGLKVRSASLATASAPPACLTVLQRLDGDDRCSLRHANKGGVSLENTLSLTSACTDRHTHTAHVYISLRSSHPLIYQSSFLGDIPLAKCRKFP